MITDYELKLPGAVYSGENALGRLRGVLAAEEVAKAAVFTDRGILETGLLELVMAELRAAGVDAEVLCGLPPEPTYGEVQSLADQFRATGADFLVAVGGGSVMDAAKLTSLLADGAYTVRQLLDRPALGRKQVRTLMVPTTAGTGAEATPNAIVAVPERAVKVGIVNPAMLPDYVILDAAMVKSLPRALAAATGVDALAHAIECLTGKKANPFSDTFALEALDLILNHIEAACDDPEALEAKRAMQLGSFYAGAAITASGTTAVHALSYPLGGRYHIPHGVSNAILLTPVLRFNEPCCRERLAAAYDRAYRGDAARTGAEEKSRWLLRRMEEIVRHLDIPASLKPFGVPAGDLEELVEAGMGVTRLLSNNPRAVTAQDARRIYQEIL